MTLRSGGVGAGGAFWGPNSQSDVCVLRSGASVLKKVLERSAERDWQVTSVNLDSLNESGFIQLLADLDFKKEFQVVLDCESERLNGILGLVGADRSRRPSVRPSASLSRLSGRRLLFFCSGRFRRREET